MTLLRSLYLLALHLVALRSALSLDARVVTDMSKVRRSWNDALQVRDVGRHVERKKAPRFMTELYEENMRNPAILQGNTVRSLAAQSEGAFHLFNLTSLGHGEIITKAELRWLRRAHALLPGPHLYRVDLYEVMDSRVKPWRASLLLSQLLSVSMEGWEVFNITPTVTKWILNSSTNHGILLVSTLTSGRWSETTVHTAREAGYEEHEVYLVIYSDDGRRGSGRGVLPSGHTNTASPFEYIDPVQAVVRRRRSVRKAPAENEHGVNCQRTPLYVDFVKLGWSGWIISPSGYNAYHCSGSCPFPLSGSLRATNHAIVQSIVNTLKLSSKVGRPCCVPDKLQPISLLYFDDEENIVLKQYDDMVAASCACH